MPDYGVIGFFLDKSESYVNSDNRLIFFHFLVKRNDLCLETLP